MNVLKRFAVPAAGLLVIALDQACKAIFWGTRAVLIPHVLALTEARNTGMGFSMLAGVPWAAYALPPIALVLGAWLLRGQLGTRTRAALFGAVVGGAASNYIDRICLGYVRDQFEFLFMRFPVFNIADAALTISLIGLTVCLMLGKQEETSK